MCCLIAYPVDGDAHVVYGGVALWQQRAVLTVAVQFGVARHHVHSGGNRFAGVIVVGYPPDEAAAVCVSVIVFYRIGNIERAGSGCRSGYLAAAGSEGQTGWQVRRLSR